MSDPFVLFVMAILLCGTLEYLTSYFMEKAFKARWWDYSQRKFNINGRICLGTIIPFGILGLFISYVSNPFLLGKIQEIPELWLNILFWSLLAIFVVDNIVSGIVVRFLKKTEVSVSKKEDNTEEITKQVREILDQKSALHRRLMNAYPKLQAVKIKFKEEKEKIKKQAKEQKDEITAKVEGTAKEVSKRVSSAGKIVTDKVKGVGNAGKMVTDKVKGVTKIEKKKKEEDLLIMFADMDKLKYINDHYGHEYGDEAIKLIASAILHNIPEPSIPIRMGGDEFLIMNQSIPEEKAEVLIHKIQDEIQTQAEQKNLPFEISFSIGCIRTDRNTGKNLDEYVKEADEIMYQEKSRKKLNRME